MRRTFKQNDYMDNLIPNTIELYYLIRFLRIFLKLNTNLQFPNVTLTFFFISNTELHLFIYLFNCFYLLFRRRYLIDILYLLHKYIQYFPVIHTFFFTNFFPAVLMRQYSSFIVRRFKSYHSVIYCR